MLTIALTGNIAAGKTQVTQLFRRWGATVIDADQLVREVQAAGTAEFAAIVNRFGPEVVANDGTLDRARLRGLVFANDSARRDLEAIVHPAVHRRRAVLLDQARRRGDRVAVCDIPLLFESMDPAQFDAVVLVDASPALRRERLTRDRGLTPAEADTLLAAQAPAETKRAWRGPGDRRPHIIENDSDLATLELRARAVWQEIVGGQ